MVRCVYCLEETNQLFQGILRTFLKKGNWSQIKLLQKMQRFKWKEIKLLEEPLSSITLK